MDSRPYTWGTREPDLSLVTLITTPLVSRLHLDYCTAQVSSFDPGQEEGLERGALYLFL